MPPPAVRRTLRLGRCGPAAAHPLRLRRPAARALLPIAVGSKNINDLMNIVANPPQYYHAPAS